MYRIETERKTYDARCKTVTVDQNDSSLRRAVRIIASYSSALQKCPNFVPKRERYNHTNSHIYVRTFTTSINTAKSFTRYLALDARVSGCATTTHKDLGSMKELLNVPPKVSLPSKHMELCQDEAEVGIELNHCPHN